MNTAAPQAGEAGVTETQVSATNLPDDFDPMAEAIKADEATSLAPATQKTQTDTQVEPKSPTAEPGEQGATKEPTKAAAKPGEQGKPEEQANLTREQKEAQRRELTWEKINAEKAAFRQEKQAMLEQFAAMQRELAQFKQARTSGPAKDEDGVTADTYEQLAKKFEDEGNDRDAKLARQRAERLRQQDLAAKQSGAPSPQVEPWKSPEFQTEWQRHTAELIADEPELDDPANPVTKAANELLMSKQWAPFFRARPDGIRAAVEVAKILRENAEAKAMRAELEKAKAENERLTKLTQPRGSHPSGRVATGPKAVAEMTEEDVLAVAHAADSGG